MPADAGKLRVGDVLDRVRGPRVFGDADIRVSSLSLSAIAANAELARFFSERGVTAPRQGAFATEAAAQAAAASGQGVMLAIAHTVLDPLRRRTLAAAIAL